MKRVEPSNGSFLVGIAYMIASLWRFFYFLVIGFAFAALFYAVANRTSIIGLTLNDRVLEEDIGSLDMRVNVTEQDIAALELFVSQIGSQLNLTGSQVDVLNATLCNKIIMGDQVLQSQIDANAISVMTLLSNITALDAKDMTLMGQVSAQQSQDAIHTSQINALSGQISAVQAIGAMLSNDAMNINSTVMQILMDAMTLEGRVDAAELAIIALQSVPASGVGIGRIWGVPDPVSEVTNPVGAPGDIQFLSNSGSQICMGVDTIPGPLGTFPSPGANGAGVSFSASHDPGFGTSVQYVSKTCGSDARIDLDVVAGDGITILPVPAGPPTPAGPATFSVTEGLYITSGPGGVSVRVRKFRPSGIDDIDLAGDGLCYLESEGVIPAPGPPCGYDKGYVGGPGGVPGSFYRFGIAGIPSAGCFDGWSQGACIQRVFSAAMITDTDPAPGTVRYGILSTSNTDDWTLQSTFRFYWQTGGGPGVHFVGSQNAMFKFRLNVVSGFEYAINSNTLELKPCSHTYHLSAVGSANTLFNDRPGFYQSDVTITCHFQTTEGPPGSAAHPAFTTVMGWLVQLVGWFGDGTPPDFDMVYLKETITGFQSVA